MVEKISWFLGRLLYVVMNVIVCFDYVYIFLVFSDWCEVLFDFKVMLGFISFFSTFVMELLVIIPISKKHNYPSSELRTIFNISYYIKKNEKKRLIIILIISVLITIMYVMQNNTNSYYYFGLISSPLSQYEILSFRWLKRHNTRDGTVR